LATATPRAPHDPSWGRTLALLTLAGLLARIVFLLLEPRAELMGDEPSWVALADRLARGRRSFSPWNRALFFYPPVYPYFVALGHALFGTLEAVKWLQAVVGALLVLAVGRAGALVSTPRAGLLAAGITAFTPDLLWYSVHFWSETLFLIFVWWAFERLLASESSASLAAAAGAGVLWGFATLTRDAALFFAPAIAVWVAWGRRGRMRAAAFGLATVLTLAPWTYRNWVLFDAFIPVSTSGALNLWQGNARLSREEVYRQSDSVEGPAAQYRLARDSGLRAVVERQPTWFFEKLRSELPPFWDGKSEALWHIDRGAYGPLAPSCIVAATLATWLPYLAILALSVVGLSALVWSRGWGLLLAFLAYYTLIHVATVGQGRYRLPVMPVLFIAAAVAWLGWRGGTLARLTPLRRALAFALALGLLLVLLPNLLP
jgi:hypothetical protein